VKNVVYTPSFPALKDISNVTRSLATHDEAILSNFSKAKDPEEVNKRMLGVLDGSYAKMPTTREYFEMNDQEC
jgi:hypothetical protein